MRQARLAAILACGFLATSALAEPLDGVNNVHLGWLKPAERDAVIDDMVKAGVHAVRLGFLKPYPNFIAAAKAAAGRGLAIELVVNLSNGDLTAPNAPIRTGRGHFANVAHLSDADPEYFRRRFSELFGEIERQGIRLSAIEIGNEFNWTGFNGDLAILPLHSVPGEQTVEALRDPERFREGLRRYVKMVAIVKTLRDASKVNKDAKIISGGLADVPAAFAANEGAESVAPTTALKLLIGMGLDKQVDGFGVHFYPGRDKPAAEVATMFAHLVSLCTRERPCWVTEWGVAQPNPACPSDETRRLPVVQEVNDLLRDAARHGEVAGEFVFDWGDRQDPWGVWRCGGLTSSGAALFGDP